MSDLTSFLINGGADVADAVLPGIAGDLVANAIRLLAPEDRSDPEKVEQAVRSALTGDEFLKLTQAVIADKANAREMQTKAIEKSKTVAVIHGITPSLLSCGILTLLAATTWLVFSVKLAPEMEKLAYLFLGAIMGGSANMIQYWFGSPNPGDEKR